MSSENREKTLQENSSSSGTSPVGIDIPKFKFDGSIDDILRSVRLIALSIGRIKLYAEKKCESEEDLKKKDHAIKLAIGIFFENAFNLYGIFERQNVEKTQIFESFPFEAFKKIRNKISHDIDKISGEEIEKIKISILSLANCFELAKSKTIAIKNDRKSDRNFKMEESEKEAVQAIEIIGEKYKSEETEKKKGKKMKKDDESQLAKIEKEIKLVERRLKGLNSIKEEIKNLRNFMINAEEKSLEEKKIITDACKMSIFYIGFFVKDKLIIEWADENIMKNCGFKAKYISDAKNKCMHAALEFHYDDVKATCEKILNSKILENLDSSVDKLNIEKNNLTSKLEAEKKSVDSYNEKVNISVQSFSTSEIKESASSEILGTNDKVTEEKKEVKIAFSIKPTSTKGNPFTGQKSINPGKTKGTIFSSDSFDQEREEGDKKRLKVDKSSSTNNNSSSSSSSDSNNNNNRNTFG